MESFIDNDAEILWYEDDLDYDSNQVNDEINSWQSANIKEYITDYTRQPLGDFLRDETRDTRSARQFFGFIDGKLASTVVVKSNWFLEGRRFIQEHIENNEQNKKFYSTPNLSNVKAKLILNEEGIKKDNDTIMYVIVHPDKTRKGIGTRVISSVKNNIEFFAPHSKHNSLKAVIHSSNFDSRSVFEKNDFRKLNINHGPRYSYFHDYYLDAMGK